MIKLGDRVKVEGKVTEIRETEKGRLIMVKFESGLIGYSSVIVDEKEVKTCLNTKAL